MIGFEKVAQVDEITQAFPKRVKVGECECVLLRVGEQIFAIENLCPHQRYAVFHQGILEQHTITCPMHGWSFDIRTGKAVTGSGRLNILEVRVDKNNVWIKKSEDENILPGSS
ncbi:MAG: Rieske 2Fe-2S domain-containing protein [Ignavibacteriales bacterium]|nr:Rieske 2Fe-2S domain-containing protein [Ignavibacteriales bacterium]